MDRGRKGGNWNKGRKTGREILPDVNSVIEQKNAIALKITKNNRRKGDWT